MSESVTLTILDSAADPDCPPAHESTHCDADTAADALETVLREAGEGDRSERRPDGERTGSRRVYDLLDRSGNRVGTAVIESCDPAPDVDDYRAGDDHGAATHHFAGPFCGCGDHSCDAAADPAASCVNRDY